MIENTAQEAEKTTPEEEIAVEVTEDSAVSTESDGGGDELEKYTKGVSKRINKLNAKTRAAEERAAQLERIALEKENELQQYRAYSQQQSSAILAKEEEALNSKSAQVDDIYRKAVESGDPDLMSKADSLKNDISIQKEKLRVAKTRQPQQQAQENYQTYQEQPQQAQAQAPAEPTQQAKKWHEKNSWYGDAENEENTQATQFAYFTHFNLINEGFEPDSEEYYEALDSRVKKVYPNLIGVETDADVGNVEEKDQRPAVQRVASTTTSGRQQTRGKSNGVKFTKSEVERLRGLKPHNMSEEQWLKNVAREKQKIAQREAR
jgi:hypothetical protein